MTSTDLKSLREKARKGPLTIEETALFVKLARKSYLAAEQKKGQVKTRNRKSSEENQDDLEDF